MKHIYSFLIIIFLTSTAFSQTWVQKLNGRSVWSLGKDNSGNLFAGGLTGVNSRIWKSTDGGNSWDTIYIGNGSTMWGFAFDSNGNMFVANFNSGVLISTNGGTNFSITDTSNFNGERPQGIACDNNGRVYVTTSGGFFRSTNFGNTFTATALGGSNCLPVAVDGDSSNIVYVGVSAASGVGIGFYRSTDYGLTFGSNLNAGKNGYNIYQKEDGTLYMITTTSPYNVDRSSNNGLTWTTLGNAPATPRGITLDATGNIYLAGNGGAYKSTNGGSTFTNFNLTGSCTPALTFGNKILVGTSGTGAGVYIYTDSSIVGIEPISNNQPGKFILYQNYPNPFNPETRIKFDLPVSGNVILSVYNINGKEVIRLQSGKLAEGIYSYSFDGTELSSGVYYYKLVTDEYSETKRMVLVK